MTFPSRSSVVQNKLHQLRGEHFRHRLNQQQASRVSSFSTAPTLPRNLLSDAVYSQDKPNRPRTTREALFVCKPADPDEGVFTPISEEQRILVLSLVLDMDIRPPRVPRLTLLCLQSLVVSCSDEELSELVSSYIPAHLRLDLMRHTAVSNPLTTGQLKALCSDGSVSGELIVVGPFAQLTEGGLQGARHDSHNEDWDDEDSTLPLPMRTLLLISTPLSLSFVLALPPTLSKLALVNLPTPVSLHRLPSTCPLLECLDLSFNTWLAAEHDAHEWLGKIAWGRLKHLTRLGLRQCTIPAGIVVEVNKGRWDDVEIIQ